MLLCKQTSKQKRKTSKQKKKKHLSSLKYSVCLFWKAEACSTSLRIFGSLRFMNSTALKKIKISFCANAFVAVQILYEATYIFSEIRTW